MGIANVKCSCQRRADAFSLFLRNRSAFDHQLQARFPMNVVRMRRYNALEHMKLREDSIEDTPLTFVCGNMVCWM